MKIIKLISALFVFTVAQSAFATCPVNVSAEKIIDCVVNEGASDAYNSGTIDEKPISLETPKSKKFVAK